MLTAQVAVEKSLENRVTPNEPRDLPDFGAVEGTRAEMSEIWKRARIDVLVESFRNEPNLPTVENVLADLDARNAQYLSAKAKLFEGERAQAAIPSSLAFEGIKKLNDEYRNDVRQLIGDKAFAALNEERQRMQARLALGPFSVPSDLF